MDVPKARKGLKPVEFNVDQHSASAIKKRAAAALDIISRPLREELARYYVWAESLDDFSAEVHNLAHEGHKAVLATASRKEAQIIYTAIRANTSTMAFKKIYALHEAGLFLDWSVCRAVVDGLIALGRIKSLRVPRPDPTAPTEPHIHRAWIKQMRDMQASKPVEVATESLRDVTNLPEELVDLIGDFMEIKHGRRKAVEALRDEPPAKRKRIK